MNPTVIRMLMLALIALPVVATAVPSVTNVDFSQAGNDVTIEYDLATPNGACIVSLFVSTDGGVTFPLEATGATGDVGAGVAPGVDRSITWQPDSQFPNQLLPSVVLRVAAQDSTGDLSIANHGFELNPQPAATLQITTPSGWSTYNGGTLNGTSNVVGWGNFSGSTHFDSTPEGSHVGIVFLGGSPNGEAGLQQTLSSVLEANALYTLIIEVGNIDEGTANFGYLDLIGFPGYRINLFAGVTTIATDNNTLAGTIPDGEWRTSTLRTATGVAPTGLGQTLTIRLVNLDAPPIGEEVAREVNFDNIRLYAAGTGASSVGTIDTTITAVGDWWSIE